MRAARIAAALLVALACVDRAPAEPAGVVEGSLGTPAKGFFSPGLMPNLAERLTKSGALFSDQDRDTFERAYNAANQRDWPRALSIATAIHNQIAVKLITWAYLTADETSPSFDELIRFIDDNPNWPLQNTLLAKAEKAIPDSMPPTRLIAWFAGQEPLTGKGMLRLGKALIATGETDYGSKWLALAWSTHDFDTDEQADVYAQYKDYLKGQPTIDRVDHLLWSYQYDEATPLVSELPDNKRRIAEARIALMKQDKNALDRVKALPNAEQRDPGVLFDEVRYLRRRGDDDAARKLLLEIKEPEKLPHPERWWVERNYQAREALGDKDYKEAYALLARTGLRQGSSFADAEWLAGWVALRFLKRPAEALEHFQKLKAGVSFPISLARADYWTGRAAQVMGNKALAAKSYADAALFPYTFYGQLSAESPLLTNEMLTLPPVPPVDESKWGSFLNGELVTAIRLLKEIDGERYMRTLAYHLVDEAKSDDDRILIAELCREIGQVPISVRVAKKASQQHTLLADYLYPVISLPKFVGNGDPPEPALVLGLARQESEFNAKAVSPAGAFGIMQLIRSTARATAKKNGIPYRDSDLLGDADYNMQLGMAHLSDLLDYYDGSYILTAAAYNAGIANVDSWVRRMGDPRARGADPVDWIETIPFTETRNYVERVLENTGVYRERIAGRPVKFALLTDLKRTSATPVDLSYLNKTPAAAPQAEARPLPPPAPAPPSAQAEPAPVPTDTAPAVATQTSASDAQPSSPPAPTPTPKPVSAAPAPPAPTQPASGLASPAAAPASRDISAGSLGRPPAEILPGDDGDEATGEGVTDATRPQPGAEPTPLDRNWNIPANCARFIIRRDHSAECID